MLTRAQKWNRAHLIEQFGRKQVLARGASMSVADYFAYSDANTDPLPLYVFDHMFGSTVPSLLGYPFVGLVSVRVERIDACRCVFDSNDDTISIPS